jgi:hypothetical protein
MAANTRNGTQKSETGSFNVPKNFAHKTQGVRSTHEDQQRANQAGYRILRTDGVATSRKPAKMRAYMYIAGLPRA